MSIPVPPSHVAGPTYATVVPLGRDLKLILGGNFIYTHKIDLGHFPHPHLMCKNNPEEPIDLLELLSQPRATSPVAAIAPVNEDEQLRLAALDRRLRAAYTDRFPDNIPPVATYQSPVQHHIKLDTRVLCNILVTLCSITLDQIITTHPRTPSSNSIVNKVLSALPLFIGVSFIIPKKGSNVDPTIALQWVNDYHHLNWHTTKDRTPLPLADDILSTCSKAQFWAKIDMTNSFFQTKMAEEDIAKTAVATHWGLYKWTVMPMGLCNAPATPGHQRRVNDALHGLIGTICFGPWLDTLTKFDYDLQYLPGRENIVADAMSRYSFPEPLPVIVANISQLSLSDVVKQQILDAYKTDALCQQALKNIASVASEFKNIDALLYLRGRLVIPLLAPLRESILHDAQDALGHLGDVKTYQTVIQTYFWPNMSRHVKQYVQQCDSCQQTKARTTRVAGKLHTLPVPVRPMADIAVDFVGLLPTNKGFDRVLTITNQLSRYVRLLPAREADTAADVANRFHEGWHRFFGLPQRIVLDRDKLFTSKFWSALHKHLNINLQLSSAFHPETDGRSKKTNKIAFQILRSLVNREQSNWVECLTACEYAISSSVNVSTGKTPFELVLGYTPTLTQLAPIDGDKELPSVEELLALCFQSCEEARDQLAVSKVCQAAQANKDRADEPSWAVGDLILLDSSDRRKQLHTRKRRAAKLMDHFDGPYRIVAAQPGISTYTLQLNKDDSAVPFFHMGKLKAYCSNDSEIFPSREPVRPGPVDVGGEPELNIWSRGFHGRRIAIHGSLPRHWRPRRHWTAGNIGTRNETFFLSEGSLVSRRGELRLRCPRQRAFQALHAAKFKVGCPVMLLRNLDPARGLCNGTRLLLTRLHPLARSHHSHRGSCWTAHFVATDHTEDKAIS
ncbi:BQ5605_C018g08764 [Microbotryum silenes-dioicae]|uniref:BQ5605_C018g08764 protein n=1 Tax=Microbotryum silenes-dioicae TaxID=796604 RepID=A0A2X0MRW9_9BASI|nr:BQ5605_C018g08764 [Microbotryum silenes-dioicae]